MVIKSFKAPTQKEAMALAKSELGSDAVILHINRTRKGGFLGFHSKEIVEVIAAIEEEAPKAAPKRSAVTPRRPLTGGNNLANIIENKPQLPVMPEGAAANNQPVAAPMVPRNILQQYQSAGTQAGVQQAENKVHNLEPAPAMTASVQQTAPVSAVNTSIQQAVAAVVDANNIARAENRPGENQFQPLHTEIADSSNSGKIIKPMKKTASPVPESNNDTETAENIEEQETIADLQNEVAAMKAMLMEYGKNGNEAAGVETLQSALVANEVQDAVMQDMISRLAGSEIIAPKDSIKAGKALERYLRKAVRLATGITLYSDKPKIVALIGPTGVGKTTTLAKIAAKFVLESSTKVALITADTYRISAVEQLKTYSDILGLPLEIVYNPEALQEAIKKHADKQLILIDTAGRSQYNEFQMKELCELLAVDPNIEKHLVMSSTTKNSDGMELVNNFSICEPSRVIFTKVDETSTHGIILNVLHKRKLALSYLTTGQRVPDDIEPASLERLTEILLR